MTRRSRNIGAVTVVVLDYDAAIRWYCDVLDFVLVEDTPLGDGKRWVLVAPSVESETRLLIALAGTPNQAGYAGNQTGGRVFLFLETDDFDRDHSAMVAAGVRFREEPRRETYGTVAVFEDLYGNLWDLIQPAAGAA